MAAPRKRKTSSLPESDVITGDAVDAPFVVIGGDAAGMSAASKIKRDDPDANVIVFERSPHISYSMCGMPYWIAGKVQHEHELMALTVERARNERGIDVRLLHEVVALQPQAHTVTVRPLAGGAEFTQNYAKLVYATGASAARPPIAGLDLPGVFTLRWLTDAQAIQAYMAEQKPRRAVVVGAGYIGLEMVEALRERRVSVHLVEMLDQILPNFDADMLDETRAQLREQGVHLHLGARVLSISRRSGHLVVELGPNTAAEGGDPTAPATLGLDADLVIVATGVRPNVELARSAGLSIGATGALQVDAQMRTSDADIYAAGDCIEYSHIVTGRPAWIPLAPAANKSGRIAGENVLGGSAFFPGIAGTAVVKVFDYTLAITGLTEREAKSLDLFGAGGAHVGAVTIHATDRAGYYPGAEPIRTKLLFDKRDGRLLGGQLAGRAGVNKRIDILATALHARMTLQEITMLDLSYAPPYSPVYDPILVAAGVGLKDVAGA